MALVINIHTLSKFLLLLLSLVSVCSLAAYGNAQPWPNCIVYYQPNQSHPAWNKIQSAIDQSNQNTNLKFIPRTNQPDYIQLTADTDGNWSSIIGYTQGSHKVNFNPNNQMRYLHELLHAAGFIHEHQRSDRDQTVEIRKRNFEQSSMDWSVNNVEQIFLDSNNLTPYDVNSVMHYWTTAGGKRKNQLDCWWIQLTQKDYDCGGNMGDTAMYTIIRKNNRTEWFGSAEILSQYDIEGINKFYNCVSQNKFLA